MPEQDNLLYTKLLTETAQIQWSELERFFASGVLLRISADMNLITVAEALAANKHEQVATWLNEQRLQKVEVEQAQDYLARDPELWAVVVAPWVVIQERIAE